MSDHICIPVAYGAPDWFDIYSETHRAIITACRQCARSVTGLSLEQLNCDECTARAIENGRGRFRYPNWADDDFLTDAVICDACDETIVEADRCPLGLESDTPCEFTYFDDPRRGVRVPTTDWKCLAVPHVREARRQELINEGQTEQSAAFLAALSI